MRSEADFRKKVFRELKARQKAIEEFQGLIEMDEAVKVLKDLTVIKTEDNFKLVLGFAEQDIVVYLKRQIPRIKNENLINYRLGRKHEIVVPLVIFEIKTGKDLVSHALITYSHIAAEIKDKFPFVMYNLVIERTEKREETFWRQGKNFDKIFIEEKQPEMYDTLMNTIKEHLTHLMDIGII